MNEYLPPLENYYTLNDEVIRVKSIFACSIIEFDMLKQQLQQKLQQKLSPQQIQLIRLLELPAIELEERVKHELEDNPALEEGKEIADDFDRTDESVMSRHLTIWREGARQTRTFTR